MLEVYTLVENKAGAHYSTFVWRILILLEYKKVPYKLIPLTFQQVKPTIRELSGGKYDQVPVVKFEDGSLVGDSSSLSELIETKYPEPTVFQSGIQYSKFLEEYFMQHLVHFYKHSLPTTLQLMEEGSEKEYFLENRKCFLGVDLDTFVGNQAENLKSAVGNLSPIRKALKYSDFFDGPKLGYNDIILLSLFKWIEACDTEGHRAYLLEDEDPTLRQWYDRCDKVLEGFLSRSNDYRKIGHLGN